MFPHRLACRRQQPDARKRRVWRKFYSGKFVIMHNHYSLTAPYTITNINGIANKLTSSKNLMSYLCLLSTGFFPGNNNHIPSDPLSHPSVSPCRSKLWIWVKRGAFALCAIFIMMPIVEELPEIIRQRVYYHRSKLTPGSHCANPPMQNYPVNVSP